jgi:O-antigen/teichoic acid export membrane protein
MSEKQATFSNTLYSTAATYLEFFLGTIISILIARTLGPETYGMYSYLVWLSALFVIVSNGGITTGIIKFLAEARSHGPEQIHSTFAYLRRIQHISVGLFLAGGVLLALVFNEFFDEYEPTWLVFAILLAAGFKATYIFYMSASKGLEQFGPIARMVTIVAPANLLLVAIVYLYAPSLENFVYAYLAACVMYMVVMDWQVRSSISGGPANDPESALRKRIWHHVRIVWFSMILSFLILRQSEVFFLGWLSTKESIAFFNIGYTLSFALAALIPGVFSALLLPVMSRSIATTPDTAGDKVLSSVRYLCILASFMVVIGTYMAGRIIETLYGDAYQGAVLPFMVCLSALGVSAVSQAATSYLVSSDNQVTILKINIFIAAFVLILDYVLIREYGLNGAAAAFATASLLHSGAMLYQARRRLAFRWQVRDYVRIVLTSLISLLPVHVLMLIMGDTYPLIEILIGGILYLVVFAFLSIRTNCWKEEDLRFMLELKQRFSGNRFPFLDRYLSAALERSA